MKDDACYEDSGTQDLPFVNYLQEAFGISDDMARDIAFGIAHCSTGQGTFHRTDNNIMLTTSTDHPFTYYIYQNLLYRHSCACNDTSDRLPDTRPHHPSS